MKAKDAAALTKMKNTAYEKKLRKYLKYIHKKIKSAAKRGDTHISVDNGFNLWVTRDIINAAVEHCLKEGYQITQGKVGLTIISWAHCLPAITADAPEKSS